MRTYIISVARSGSGWMAAALAAMTGNKAYHEYFGKLLEQNLTQSEMVANLKAELLSNETFKDGDIIADTGLIYLEPGDFIKKEDKVIVLTRSVSDICKSLNRLVGMDMEGSSPANYAIRRISKRTKRYMDRADAKIPFDKLTSNEAYALLSQALEFDADSPFHMQMWETMKQFNIQNQDYRS